MMENWQKDAIDKNMLMLCKQTSFCPGFLDCLQRNELIISIESGEFERIQKHEKHGNYKCNQYLYDLLKTRCHAYDILIDLLKEHHQTELAGILEDEKSANLEDSPVLPEGYQPSCEVPGTSATSLKRALNLHHTAGTPRPQKSRKLLFDLQDPTPLFVGRKQELADVHKLLNESNRRAVITHITSVSGLGGIGKTQLARKYAQDYKDQYDNNISWINAESEESITSSFLKLASDKLNLSTKNANDKEKDVKIVVGDCYEYFERRKWKCLFIFDNLEKENLQKFLPKKDTSQFIYVLITSRQQDWGKSVQVIGLDVWSEDEAIAFVKDGLEIEDGLIDEEVKVLVRRLQYFPLAISQAVSYISNQQKMDDYSIMNYLDEFEISTSHLLDWDSSEELECSYTKTTFTTWKITINRISQTPEYGQLALGILNLVSYFFSENIYRDIFFEFDDLTETMVKQAVNLLVKYSMVMAKERQSIFSIHRLVQEVVRIDLRRTGNEKETIEMALELAEKCISLNFVAHAISAWNYAKGVPQLVCKFVSLAKSILLVLQAVGRYKEACHFGTSTLQILEISSFVNKRSILEFQLNLGIVLRFAGEYAASLSHLEIVQEECKSLENNDTLLVDVEQQIAWVLNFQGRNAKAFQVGLKICESNKAIFGDKHLSTAKSLFMTAALAYKIGDYDLSYSIFEDGFKCYKQACEKDEVNFLQARHNFALLVADRGNTTEALEILQGIYSKIIENPALNVSFSFRTNTLRNICNYLNATNKYAEAHKMLEELYKEQNSVLGEEHQDSLITLNNLAKSLLGMKRYEEAYSAGHTSYLKLEEKYGLESSWTIEAQRICALVLSRQGHHSSAISFITEVVERRVKTLEFKNIEVLNAKFDYAEILARANKCKEALEILEELKETYLQVFGADHRDYVKCVGFIGKIKLGGSELRDWLEF